MFFGFTDKTILVPLTNSLYVPGKLCDLENVIVDVGTGYYVKKVYTYYFHWSKCAEQRSFDTTDSSPSNETLRRKSGIHQDKLGNAARVHPEETGEYELPYGCTTSQVASSGICERE